MAYIIEWIVYLNSVIVENISPYFPDTGAFGFFATYSLYILLGFFLVTGAIALLFDFIKDAWKIPFGIFGDMLDILAMQYPGLFDGIAALYSVVIFHVLAKKPEIFHKFAMGAGFIENIIGIDFPIAQFGSLGNYTNLFPTNTILMLIATIID